MIRLLECEFENFRLLRNAKLKFSTDPERPLTVIRGENDSGKTTILTALGWALFGDDALPTRRTAYRLYPVNWSIDNEGPEARIRARLRFVASDEDTGEEATYTLERTTSDIVRTDGSHTPQISQLMLFCQTPTRTVKLENPNAFMNSVLPKALKDVFLIDGDRALGFIEATDARSEKRERVEAAIRSLLGLETLEAAEKHVAIARRDAIQATKRETAGTDLGELTAQKAALEQVIQDAATKRATLVADRDATETRRRHADDRLKNALASGGRDRKALGADLVQAEGEGRRLTEHFGSLLRTQQSLLNSTRLCSALAGNRLRQAAELLADLEARKVIPNTLPSVVRDRLEKGVCICGADLSAGTPQFEVLTGMLHEAEHSDEARELLAFLNDGVRRQLREVDGTGSSWADLARQNLGSIKQTREAIESNQRRVGELRARVSEIPDINIGELERLVSEEDAEARRLRSEIGEAEATIARAEGALKLLNAEREQNLKRQERHHLRYAEETAASDLQRIIQETIKVLQTETLGAVSESMNDIFMSMIVAGIEEDRAILRRVELTPDYDILVHGPDNRTLDPDRDLNGASRRALTLAFILALVKLSGVRAPLVVDTPIGMTSGPVREAIVSHAIANASQLVLFLTRDEIHGVEHIIDRRAGAVYTITNTAHYPSKLANDPGAGPSVETLVCACDHRHECAICERRAVAA